MTRKNATRTNHTTSPKRFREFDERLIEFRLKDLVTFKSGGTPSMDEASYWNGEIPWISAAAMIGKYYSKSDRTITEKGLNGSTLAPKGTLLILVRGSMLFNKIPIGIVEKNVAFNQDVKAIFTNEQLDTEYLYQWFSAKEHFLLSKVVGTGIGAGKLNMGDLNNLEVLLPSLSEQQKIAAFLTSVDTKIQQLTKKKALLEQYKKGVMQKIFKQEIRFKDEKGRDYPKWKFLRGKELFVSQVNRRHNGDLPILAATQENGMVYRDSIGIEIQSSEASVKSYKVVEQGDFVISLRSFQGGIEYSEFEGICSPAYTILKPKVIIDNAFFKYYFKKEDFITRLSKTVVGIRDGKQISYEAFSGLKLPFPVVEEQKRISDFIAEIDMKIDQVTKQLVLVKDFKKGLLQQMFV